VPTQEFTYLRLFADAQGESHFEDRTAAMEPASFAPPAPPLNVSLLGEASALSLVGGSRAWGGERPHPSPARQVMCVLVGELEVRASDGTARTLRPGNLLLLEDTSGKGHSSHFLSEEVVLAAVRLSA
jgi:hypothetical protein